MTRRSSIFASWATLLLLSTLGMLHAVSEVLAQEPEHLGPQRQLNAHTPENQLLPRVSALPGQGFLVVWHSGSSTGDDQSDTSIQGHLFDSAGIPLGEDFQVNTQTLGNQRAGAAAIDSTGRGLIVWESESTTGDDADGLSIQARVFDAQAGGPVGVDFQVSSTTQGDQSSPEIAASSNGELMVVWRSDSSAGNDDSSTSIQGQRFELTGQAIGDELQINTYTSGAQSRPALHSTPDGGFVVAWESDGSASDSSGWSVQARRFASDGIPLGQPFQVNTFTTSLQRDPSVAVAPNGDTLVTWQSSTSAESDLDWGIHGRLFDAQTNPLGGQFQVNTTTESDQYYSAVIHDGTGFLVTWKSFGSTGSDEDLSIQTRRYRSDGAPLGAEVQVNTHTPGAQKLPRIARLDRGNAIVVWESETSPETDNSSWSIQGQLLSLPIFNDGFESGDTSLWTTSSPVSPF